MSPGWILRPNNDTDLAWASCVVILETDIGLMHRAYSSGRGEEQSSVLALIYPWVF